eukprot:scpid92725/ scgid28359/ 
MDRSDKVTYLVAKQVILLKLACRWLMGGLLLVDGRLLYKQASIGWQERSRYSELLCCVLGVEKEHCKNCKVHCACTSAFFSGAERSRRSPTEVRRIHRITTSSLNSNSFTAAGDREEL